MDMLLPINPRYPQPRRIGRVVQALQAGKIIAYPTDTLYGFACSVQNRKAVKKLYKIKNEKKNKRMSFICSDLSQITKYGRVSDYAYKTIKKILPGPYTIILEATKQVPKIVLTKQHTVGIRIPDSLIAVSLAEALGHPLLTTSVPAGEYDGYHDPVEIDRNYKKHVDITIDAGTLPIMPSTVLGLVDDYPILYREGKGSLDQLGIVIHVEEDE